MAPLGEKDTGGGAHMSDTNDKIRIVQETVAGKEITFAHVIGGLLIDDAGRPPSSIRSWA